MFLLDVGKKFVHVFEIFRTFEAFHFNEWLLRSKFLQIIIKLETQGKNVSIHLYTPADSDFLKPVKPTGYGPKIGLPNRIVEITTVKMLQIQWNHFKRSYSTFTLNIGRAGTKIDMKSFTNENWIFTKNVDIPELKFTWSFYQIFTRKFNRFYQNQILPETILTTYNFTGT